MACLLNTAYSLGCNVPGGIAKVYARNWSAGTVWSADSNGQYTAATNSSSSFYTLEMRPETADLKEDGQFSLENGSIYYQDTLSLLFRKWQASTRNLVYVMGQAPMEFIVLSTDGNYFAFGEQFGADMNANTNQLGKTFGDLQGSTCSFMAKRTTPFRPVSSTLVASLTIV